VTARRFIKLICASFAILGGCSPLVVLAATPTGAEPLLQQSDLKYEGAFRLPVGTTDQTSFAFGNGTGLTYNPANNSLIMVGHVFYQLSAEVSIPAVINSTSLSDLATATLLQPFADVSDGNRPSLGVGRVYVGGQMVYGGRLIGSAYNQDDPNQAASHFTSELDLSIAGDFQGFYSVGTFEPRFVSGYMTQIPLEWQASFGGPAITGGCCNLGATNVGGMSWGPSAFVFDPDDLGVNIPTPATPLVYYSQNHPTLGAFGNTTVANPAFNLMTNVTGVVFPQGTRTVLFFGGTGTGVPCFGNGTNDPALDHQPITGSPGKVWCYDPLEVNGGIGPHAFPYAYQVWAYDVEDLLAARNGQVNPWDVVPYGIWTLTLPFDNPRRYIFGAAYDSLTDRIFISQARAEPNGMPVIHVFNVEVDQEITPPPPPALAQCEDGVDNDSDGLTDLADPGCSDVSDDNESDDPSQSSTTQSKSGSLEPFTLLLLLCAFVALRRRAGVI